MALTHWKKLNNPAYLGAYSIEEGQDLVLTIKTVRQESVIGPDGKKDECMVCYFTDSEKPMILNSTNAKQISKLLKTPYIEQWAGHRIQIGIEKVKAFGDVVEALRVRNRLPASNKVVCESCGKEIVASSNMTPDQIAKYAYDRTGKRLCVNCFKAVSAKNG